MIKTLLAAGLTATVLLSSGSGTKEAEDLEAIKQTALAYGQGWYEGNAERMEQALHPDLAKRAFFPDPLRGKARIDHLSALGLVQATREGHGTKTPKDQQRTEVKVLDVFGNAATVRLRMHDWVDYMHMTKLGGRWVIVNVLWELSPEAKKKYGIPEEL